ncbi:MULTISPECIES: GNAT family N-acetyltransferase [unclassified Jeotgalicoccus]|uniref:GNAT family N-acetyltransferase n=1 Tax=unclassified Jeotgalicoccus TaxID=2630462 RepID=UPI001415108C|nr:MULTISPECIES: GNAT family N-acetyltransferase [unclassified Jeotgalicoccus]QQD84319.1 GNAT family N-acetyltransferase [Jeotgalicoccus sp. ATCC 8456]
MLEKLEDKAFDLVYQLMAESFPESERRTYQGQKDLLKLNNYNILVLKENDDILAFYAVWENEKYRFIEHLAVNPNYRSRGLGSKTLQAFHDLDNKPVILEVEAPDDETKKRRVQFYEKNGYYLTDFKYMQPKINKDLDTVELVQMTYPRELSTAELTEAKAWLDRTVYKEAH